MQRFSVELDASGWNVVDTETSLTIRVYETEEEAVDDANERNIANGEREAAYADEHRDFWRSPRDGGCMDD